MHLIIVIALGVFGGLWLFVKWSEWRVNREIRREIRAERRQAKQREWTEPTVNEPTLAARPIYIGRAVAVLGVTIGMIAVLSSM